MTVAMILKPAAGNALRVFLQPPAGARRWRLLRKLADDFTGQADADAAVVEDGDTRVCTDTDGLVNGVTYYYRPYYWVSGAWQAGATAFAAPVASYEDQTPDVVTIVRDRLSLGLQEELRRGVLVHENGAVPVFTAPPAYDQARWPMVSVHLENEDPAERFIGESVTTDVFDDGEGLWTEPEGYLAQVELTIIGWSLNPDERIELRKALRRIVIANFSVFDSYGIVTPKLTVQDMEDFENYAAPVYQAMCKFSCMTPVSVLSSVGPIDSVSQQVLTP
jgi:hypothetical protein